MIVEKEEFGRVGRTQDRAWERSRKGETGENDPPPKSLHIFNRFYSKPLIF